MAGKEKIVPYRFLSLKNGQATIPTRFRNAWKRRPCHSSRVFSNSADNDGWSSFQIVFQLEVSTHLAVKSADRRHSQLVHSEEPDGLLGLDPQLVCDSWMTGISEVAQVAFVRKRLVEVQYLRTTSTDEQRGEFGRLVEDTIGRIESAQCMPHSGIRFPTEPLQYVPLCRTLPRQTGAGPSQVNLGSLAGSGLLF